MWSARPSSWEVNAVQFNVRQHPQHDGIDSRYYPAMLPRVAALALLAIAAVLVDAGRSTPSAAEPIRLTRITHIYGIAPDPGDASRMLLATERGFFAATPDGNAEQLLDTATPVMAFTVAPHAGALYATAGEKQGALVSRDQGRTWARIAAEGTPAPGPFLLLEASPADPQVLYGAAAGVLYRSADAGRSWNELGAAPAPVVDLAGATGSRDGILLGTARGLYRSVDGGKTWALAGADGSTRPVSIVATLPDGQTYGFVTGVGMVRIAAQSAGWTMVAPAVDFDGAILHLTGHDSGRWSPSPSS